MKIMGGGIALLFLLFSCSSSPGSPKSAWRIPQDFRIVGYFPSWSGDPATVNYRALTHIAYAFVLVDNQGSLKPLDDPDKLKDLVQRAHHGGVKVMVSLGGWNDGNTNAFETVSASEELTSNLLKSILRFLDAYALDGVDLDWEFPNDRTEDDYARLVQALALALHPRGDEVSLAVTATEGRGKNFKNQALLAADWINIMAYDGSSRQEARNHSSYNYARSALDYWLNTRKLLPEKIVLGVPFYGRSLIDRKSRSYASILKEDPQAWTRDESDGFGYNGFDTLRAKIVNQARFRSGGVMVWQLNQDTEGSHSLLQLIYDTVKEPTE